MCINNLIKPIIYTINCKITKISIIVVKINDNNNNIIFNIIIAIPKYINICPKSLLNIFGLLFLIVLFLKCCPTINNTIPHIIYKNNITLVNIVNPLVESVLSIY